MPTVGVYGVGVVGGAVYEAFIQKGFVVYGYDKFKDEFRDIDPVLRSEVIFVCVPTPTIEGLQDITPLVESLATISLHNYKGVVCVKSTVLPGTMDDMHRKFPKLRLAHNPEFLTEKNALKDFLEQEAVLISGDLSNLLPVSDIYSAFDPSIRIMVYLDFEYTEMAKYVANVFKAAKVSFFNDMFEICEKIGLHYPTMIEGALQAGSIAPHHTKVPGENGQRGWAGACFPKDVVALAHYASSLLLHSEVLYATVNGNKRRQAEAMKKVGAK